MEHPNASHSVAGPRPGSIDRLQLGLRPSEPSDPHAPVGLVTSCVSLVNLTGLAQDPKPFGCAAMSSAAAWLQMARCNDREAQVQP